MRRRAVLYRLKWLRRGATLCGAIVVSVAGFDAEGASIAIIPSISVKETISDNADGSSGEGGFITEITPSVNVSLAGPWLTGGGDAEFRTVLNSSQDGGRQSFLQFNGHATYEIIENTLFLDAAGNVGRNNLSLFTGRSQWDGNSTDSKAETRYFSLTPRWNQRIGNVRATVIYQIQFLSSASDLNNQGNGSLKASIAQDIDGSPLGWRVDYARSDTNTYSSDQNATVKDNSLTGTISYRFNSQLSVYGRGGREANNYQSARSEDGITKGFGTTWAPTPRTLISGDKSYHTYGDAYNLKISHRLSRMAFDFGLSKSISSGFQTATNSLGNYYYNLFSSALLATYPDPVERQRVVLGLLKALGIQVGPGFGAFNTNAYFSERTINGGLTLIGGRNSLALSAFRSNREALGRRSELSGDDDFRDNQNLKTYGATFSATHQLTPNSSLNGSVFWSKATGDAAGGGADSRRLGLSVGASTKFGARTSGVITFRRESVKGSSQFTENSISLAATMSF